MSNSASLIGLPVLRVSSSASSSVRSRTICASLKHVIAAAFIVIGLGPARAGFGPAEAGRYPQSGRTFTVGTASATRGQTAFGVIRVPQGSDAGYDIPVAVVHGASPGPVLAVV